MIETHRYEITFKKEDLHVELSSDDERFISRQMNQWFRTILEENDFPPLPPAHAPELTPPPALEPVAAAPLPAPETVTPVPAPVAEPVALQSPLPIASVDTLPPVTAAPPPVVSPPPAPAAPVVPVAPPEAVAPAPVEVSPAPVVETPAPAAAAVDTAELPDAFDDPAPSESEYVPLPQAPVVAGSGNEADFERVLDTLMEDLDPEASRLRKPKPALTLPSFRPASKASASGDDAAAPAPVDPSPVIASLQDLCERAQPASSEDWLMMAAYYLVFFEGEERFSLKRLNSLLVKSGQSPLNHSVLETAVSKGLLSLAPDITGLAESIEYALAPSGREAAESLMR